MSFAELYGLVVVATMIGITIGIIMAKYIKFDDEKKQNNNSVKEGLN